MGGGKNFSSPFESSFLTNFSSSPFGNLGHRMKGELYFSRFIHLFFIQKRRKAAPIQLNTERLFFRRINLGPVSFLSFYSFEDCLGDPFRRRRRRRNKEGEGKERKEGRKKSFLLPFFLSYFGLKFDKVFPEKLHKKLLY